MFNIFWLFTKRVWFAGYLAVKRVEPLFQLHQECSTIKEEIQSLLHSPRTVKVFYGGLGPFSTWCHRAAGHVNGWANMDVTACQHMCWQWQPLITISNIFHFQINL